MPDQTKHAVVVEWGDGTVDVNGPYDTPDLAIRAARLIAWDLSIVEERRYTKTDDGGLVGSDSEDQIHVYTRAMGTPPPGLL